jgi:hypothetical protein
MQIDKCFDASGFLVMTIQQNQTYKDAWNTFNRIQTINSNVSTIRAVGNKNVYYYNYKTNAEKLQFIQGQSLHMRIYPSFSSFWMPVEKN